jgi:dephospho-CoA kinase
MLVERGAILVDADEIAREVTRPGTPAWAKIVEHFGRDVLLSDGRIDRTALAEIVFRDRARLALLNEITHPEVMRRIADRLEELRGTDRVVVVDVPLLVEAGAAGMFDVVVVVAASEEVQVDRLRRFRGMSEEAARARIAAQARAEERAAVADWLITNDSSLEALAAQVERLWRFLEARRGGPASRPG